MERSREIKSMAKSQKVLDGDRSTQRALMLCPLLVHRYAGQLNPFIVSKPRRMINDMPCTDARKPGADSVPSLPTFVLSNKGTKEGVGSRHSCFLVNTPSITELGEAQSTSSIRGVSVRCICTMDGHHGTIDQIWGKRVNEVLSMTSRVGCLPGK